MFDQLIRPTTLAKPARRSPEPGSHYYEDGVRKRVKSPNPRKAYPPVQNPWGMSGGECMVMKLICEGLTQREAGESIGVSGKTIATLLSRAISRMAAHDLATAITHWQAFQRDGLPPWTQLQLL